MKEFVLTQMHIECARNSTDDFNLFHDKSRWQKILNNPFGGPIALGFQLACFIEDQTNIHRHEEEKDALSQIESLGTSEFELTFAGIVKPNDKISAVIRSGKLAEQGDVRVYSNRIVLKSNDKVAMLGFKRDTDRQINIANLSLPSFATIKTMKDRSFCNEIQWFVKRKYMIVGNAKNFLNSAFAEQSEYIDEFADKIEFPQTYPLSLISSALLERAKASGKDLIAEPMIYTAQKLQIDKKLLKQLQSNDRLTILVNEPTRVLGSFSTITKFKQTTVGLIQDNIPLFKGSIELTPLSSLLD